jgi:hypothetical protein
VQFDAKSKAVKLGTKMTRRSSQLSLAKVSLQHTFQPSQSFQITRSYRRCIPACFLPASSFTSHKLIMPPIRTSRNRKPPPAGFDDIEDTLLEFSNKMKDAENASHDGKKRYEVLWPIFQISHQRTFRPLRAPPGHSLTRS